MKFEIDLYNTFYFYITEDLRTCFTYLSNAKNSFRYFIALGRLTIGMHVRLTDTQVSMISGVILSRQNVLNEMPPLSIIASRLPGIRYPASTATTAGLVLF